MVSRIYQLSGTSGNLTVSYGREPNDLLLAYTAERSGNPSSAHGLTDQSGQTYHKFFGDEQDPGGSGQLSVAWWRRAVIPGESNSQIMMPTAPGTVACGLVVYRSGGQNYRLKDVVSAGDIVGNSPLTIGPTNVVDSDLFASLAVHRNQSSACPTNPGWTNLVNPWEQSSCSTNRLWASGAEDTVTQTAAKDTSYSWDGAGHEVMGFIGAFKLSTQPRRDQMQPLGGEIIGWVPSITARDNPTTCPDVFTDNDGTITGGVTAVRQRNDYGAVYHWDFDGTGSITLANEINLVGHYAAGCWFRKGLDNEQLWASSTDPAMGVYVINDTTIRVNYGTNYDFTIPALGFVWHHLAVRFRDGNLSVFIDGNDSTTGPLASVDTQFKFGNLGVSSFTGDVDDFRIFNQGLSASQILELSSRHAYQRRVYRGA